MRREHFGPHFGGNHPVAGDGHVAHHHGIDGLLFFPAAEIDGAGKRRHHDKLREGDAGLDRHFDRGGEGGGPVGGQAEDERAEDVHAVLLEGLELLGEGFAGVVPVFVDGFEPLGRDGFNADQRALDVGFAHGVEIAAVFAGFHGHLREEDHVLGQLGQLFHQLTGARCEWR